MLGSTHPQRLAPPCPEGMVLAGENRSGVPVFKDEDGKHFRILAPDGKKVRVQEWTVIKLSD